MTLDRATRLLSGGTTAIHLAVAAALGLLAVLSLGAVGADILAIAATGDFSGGIVRALHAILVTIIIIELLDTVVVYARTHQFRVQPILVAGITAMVRRILLIGVEAATPVDTAVNVASILALALALVLVDRVDNRTPGGSLA